MQYTADFHHHVANPSVPHLERLLEPAAACDTAVDMFKAHAPLRDLPMPRLLGRRQLGPTRLLGGLDDGHAAQCAGLNSRLLQLLTSRRQRRGYRIGDAHVVDTTRMRLARGDQRSKLIHGLARQI